MVDYRTGSDESKGIGYSSGKCPNCGYNGMDYNSMNYQDSANTYDIFRQHGFGITQMYKY